MLKNYPFIVLLSGGVAGAMYGGGLGQEESEKKEMEHTLTFSMLGKDKHLSEISKNKITFSQASMALTI